MRNTPAFSLYVLDFIILSFIVIALLGASAVGYAVHGAVDSPGAYTVAWGNGFTALNAVQGDSLVVYEVKDGVAPGAAGKAVWPVCFALRAVFHVTFFSSRVVV